MSKTHRTIRLDHYHHGGSGHPDSRYTSVRQGQPVELKPSDDPNFPWAATITCSSCHNTYLVGTYSARVYWLRRLALTTLWLAVGVLAYVMLSQGARLQAAGSDGSGYQIVPLFAVVAAIIPTIYLVRTLHIQGSDPADAIDHRAVWITSEYQA